MEFGNIAQIGSFIVALAANLVIGYTGMMAMGQAAYLGFGAYVAAALNVLVGVTLGVIIPMTLHRLNQDPALSGGIWLTMCTDAGGFLTYLTFATIFIEHITE